ncbi:phosphatidylserine synthase [Ilyonectria robusta]
MLVRSCTRCTAKLRAPVFKAAAPHAPAARFQCRRYSMPAGGAPVSPAGPVTGVGALAPFVSELDRLAPSFDVRGDQIRIIKTPAEFYETLKVRRDGLRVKRGDLHHRRERREHLGLMPGLGPNPQRPEPHLPVDAVHWQVGEGAHRDAAGGAATDAGAQAEHPERCAARHAGGARPVERFVAGAAGDGVWRGPRRDPHDRYHLFSSKEITEHFWQVHSGVASFSFLVKPSQDEAAGFTLAWPKSNSAPSPLEKPESFIKSTTSTLQALIQPGAMPTSGDITDTRVYMLGQMSQIMKPDTSTELPIVTHILKTLGSPAYRDSSWTFTAGYFNPAPSLTKLLMGTASSNNTVITAHPEANGFYQSKGVSGLLPDAYTLLARRFLHRVHHEGRDASITLKEWRHGVVGQPGGWTYHAKGLWVTMPGDAHPAMSIIGSSNYTKRSYSHDLEAGALIVTRDDGLKAQLADEQRWLQEHAARVTRDDLAVNERRVGLKVRVAMWIVSLVGGAL